MQARTSEEKHEPKDEECEERKQKSPSSPTVSALAGEAMVHFLTFVFQSPGVNQLIATGDVEMLEALVKSREQNIITLEAEIAKYRDELNIRTLEVSVAFSGSGILAMTEYSIDEGAVA